MLTRLKCITTLESHNISWKITKSATQSHQHTVQIRLKLFGENHADTAQSYRVIGLTKHSKHTMDDYIFALDSYLGSFIIRMKLIGDNHPDSVQSYQDIELLRRAMKNYNIC